MKEKMRKVTIQTASVKKTHNRPTNTSGNCCKEIKRIICDSALILTLCTPGFGDNLRFMYHAMIHVMQACGWTCIYRGV